MSVWNDRAQAYRQSATHAFGDDLDLLVSWAEPGPGVRALDVATGGGHVAQRLRAAGCEVVSADPAPAMEPDVICAAEELPFPDGSFDVVVTRIAPHHFADVAAAVREMARVSRRLVLIEDTLYASEAVEEAERLRDPSHVRSYSEAEWRKFLQDAGLRVQELLFVRKQHPFEAWLSRTDTARDLWPRIRELLGERVQDDTYEDTKILLRAEKLPA
jgi:ubiquinone/menaquinone biosynthesis C-methylase UbiE